ncbi:hypothetical protein LTR85_001968 [Meristemomyces frigidus]|nr:hypothetical protein LTR85_001968 [Meristemomyces frigidus]
MAAVEEQSGLDNEKREPEVQPGRGGPEHAFNGMGGSAEFYQDEKGVTPLPEPVIETGTEATAAATLAAYQQPGEQLPSAGLGGVGFESMPTLKRARKLEDEASLSSRTPRLHDAGFPTPSPEADVNATVGNQRTLHAAPIVELSTDSLVGAEAGDVDFEAEPAMEEEHRTEAEPEAMLTPQSLDVHTGLSSPADSESSPQCDKVDTEENLSGVGKEPDSTSVEDDKHVEPGVEDGGGVLEDMPAAVAPKHDDESRIKTTQPDHKLPVLDSHRGHAEHETHAVHAGDQVANRAAVDDEAAGPSVEVAGISPGDTSAAEALEHNIDSEIITTGPGLTSPAPDPQGLHAEQIEVGEGTAYGGAERIDTDTRRPPSNEVHSVAQAAPFSLSPSKHSAAGGGLKEVVPELVIGYEASSRHPSALESHPEAQHADGDAPQACHDIHTEPADVQTTADLVGSAADTDADAGISEPSKDTLETATSIPLPSSPSSRPGRSDVGTYGDGTSKPEKPAIKPRAPKLRPVSTSCPIKGTNCRLCRKSRSKR